MVFVPVTRFEMCLDAFAMVSIKSSAVLPEYFTIFRNFLMLQIHTYYFRMVWKKKEMLLFKAYFPNRKQCMEINKCTSFMGSRKEVIYVRCFFNIDTQRNSNKSNEHYRCYTAGPFKI